MRRLKKLLPFVAAIAGVAFVGLLVTPVRSQLRRAGPDGKPAGEQEGAALGIFRKVQLPAGKIDTGRRFDPKAPPRKAAPPTVDEQFSAVLDDVQEQARRAALRAAAREPIEAELKALRADKARLEAMVPDVAGSFRQTAQRLLDDKLPDVFRERHLEAEGRFTARLLALTSTVQLVLDADASRSAAGRDAAVGKLVAFFDEHRQGEPVQKLDPLKLPFRGASADVGPPIGSPDELPASLREAPATGSTRALTTDPDLAETVDVQLTPAIREHAARLGNNPVQIFNWVRNNIEWLPTYGSVQGSNFTLLTKRGNAFDTSSLLIALLRAARTPARYVYGTIEVPAAKAMNWAGNLSNMAAVQQLIGQGSIPNVAMSGPAGLASIRMEHVWVEAFVDAAPSRGAINKSPDTWVPLDPSFKQYDYAARTDPRVVTVDNEATAAKVTANAVFDPATGSLTGLGGVDMEGWADDLVDGLAFTFGTKPDLAAFMGRKTIVVEDGTLLPGAVPNRIVTRAAVYSALPASLRHRVSLTLLPGSPLERAFGTVLLSKSVDMPAFAGKRLGVTWLPATDADAATLASYRNSGATSIPVYLIHVVPSVRIDDTEIARGPSVTMGTQVDWDVGIVSPRNGIDLHAYRVSAGDEIVFGVDHQGLGQEAISARFRERPSETAAENLFTVAMYFWAQYDVLSQAAALSRNVVIQRLPSLGVFSAPLQVSYFFGIPRSGTYRSRQMDVGHSIFAQVERANGSTRDFQGLSGRIGSLLEGRTFDGLFERPWGTGVSAVQLLREANDQRIPIYFIDRANHSTIAPQLQVGSSVAGAISNAIAAGKTVIVSQRAPVRGNWSGLGYIIEDPATGSAAYLINGNLNGGADDPCVPDRKPEPVRIPILEILLVILIIIAIILLLIMLGALAAAVAAAMTPQAAGAAAALLLLLGLAGTSTPAYAAPPAGPPLPGEGMLPPGDCTPAQYAGLKAAVEGSCKTGPACSGDCATMVAALARLQACVAARSAIMVACFRGGDQRHADALAQAERAVANCACKIAAKCK